MWNTAVVVGALAGQALGDISRYGLDAAFPAILAALVVPTLRKDSRVRRPVALGAGLALAATPLLSTGVPVLVALLGLFLYAPEVAP